MSGDENHDGGDLRALLERNGHTVRYQSVHKPGLEAALAEPADVVAVAGGDGTVAKVMRHLAGSPVPLALLPSGTANNIAAALGVGNLEADELVDRWPSGRRTRYVLGEVDTGEATRCFAEAVGGGLVAAAIDPGWEVSRRQVASEPGVQALRELIDVIPAREWKIEADGNDASGEYLAIELMVVGITGPNLPLSPAADPSDELLDLVMIPEHCRDPLRRYFEARLSGEDPVMPMLPALRAGRVTVTSPSGVELRLDDELWSPPTNRFVARCNRSVVVVLP